MTTSTPDEGSRVSKPVSGPFGWACGLQGVIVIILFFGDIGFDHPGRFGLDFGHLLLLLAVDVILIAWAATIAIRARSWSYAGIQMLLVLAVVAAGIRA